MSIEWAFFGAGIMVGIPIGGLLLAFWRGELKIEAEFADDHSNRRDG